MLACNVSVNPAAPSPLINCWTFDRLVSPGNEALADLARPGGQTPKEKKKQMENQIERFGHDFEAAAVVKEY